MITVMADKKIDKAVIRIAVSADAKKVVEHWAAEQDMTEIGVASRIYEWFGQQPEAVQRAILGLFGGLTGDVAAFVLSQMATANGQRPPLDEAAIQRVINRVQLGGSNQGGQSHPRKDSPRKGKAIG